MVISILCNYKNLEIFLELYFYQVFLSAKFNIQKHSITSCANLFCYMWFKFVKFITSVLLLEKFWNNYSMFMIMFRLLCKNLSFRTIVVWSVEIYLLLNMVCFEYFSCIHALLFLSKIFTASFWLYVLPCINSVEPETIPSLWS